MICWLQGEESPVCHHDGGPAAADSGQRGLDVPLGLGVQGGRGLRRRTQQHGLLAYRLIAARDDGFHPC